MDSAAGDLIRRAQRIMFSCSVPFAVTLEEVTCEEYSVMMTLRNEEARFTRQKGDRERAMRKPASRK